MTRWVVEHLGPDVPMHFTAFHPDYKMLDVPRDAAGDARARAPDRARERHPLRLHGQRARRRWRQHVLPRLRHPRDRARLVHARRLASRRRRTLLHLRHAVRGAIRRAAGHVGRATPAGPARRLRGAPVTRVRRAAVAGLFYPDDPRELAEAVGTALDVAVPEGEPAPKAVIVPHAGYVYSGAIAGSAYARLRALAGRIRHVVLLGPAHRVADDDTAVGAMERDLRTPRHDQRQPHRPPGRPGCVDLLHAAAVPG